MRHAALLRFLTPARLLVHGRRRTTFCFLRLRVSLCGPIASCSVDHKQLACWGSVPGMLGSRLRPNLDTSRAGQQAVELRAAGLRPLKCGQSVRDRQLIQHKLAVAKEWAKCGTAGAGQTFTSSRIASSLSRRTGTPRVRNTSFAVSSSSSAAKTASRKLRAETTGP